MLFRTKLYIWSMTLSTLPILVMCLWLYHYSISIILENDIDSAVQINSNIRGSLDRVFFDVNNTMIEMLSNAEIHDYLTFGKMPQEISSLSSPGFYESSEDFMKKYEKAVIFLKSVASIQKSSIYRILVYPSGEMPVADYNCTNDISRMADENDLKHMYNDSIEKKGQIIWNIVKNTDRQDINIIVSAAVKNINVNSPIGVAYFQLTPRYLESILGDSEKVDGRHIIVLSENNEVVYHKDRSKIGKPLDDEYILEGIDGNRGYSIVSHMNEKQIVIYDKSTIYGWKIISVMPYASVSNKFDRFVRIAIFVLLLTLVFSLVVAFFITGTAKKPLGVLLDAMQKMDKDNLNVEIEPIRKDEFGTLTVHFNHLVQRINNLVSQVELEQTNKKESEMNALRAQITPHFLYNTLNTVRCLTKDGEVESAYEVTGGLIDLLRISLGNNDELISLRDEIHIVSSYITLQQYRNDIHFEISYNINEELYAYKIQKFTLQPIIENAILHGFAGRAEENHIELSAYKKEQNLVISVIDNGIGLYQSYSLQYYKHDHRYTSNGIGLGNVLERIKLRFGEEYGLSIQNAKPHGVEVTVIIPAIGEDL